MSPPGIIAIAPNGRTAYVSYDISQKFGVIPISTATSRAGKPIPVASLPTFIAFTPDGKLAYVTDDGAGEVTPIRVATNTPEPPIKVGRATASSAPSSSSADRAQALPHSSRPDLSAG